jgi:hypothetical protein
MNIEVIKNTETTSFNKNADPEREVWQFYIFAEHSPITVRLASYQLQTKTPRQKIWRTSKVWDNYDKRRNTLESIPDITKEVLDNLKLQLKTMVDNLKVIE